MGCFLFDDWNGWGWQAENIRNTLEQQMTFFARLVGGFQVADDIAPMRVDNFDN